MCSFCHVTDTQQSHVGLSPGDTVVNKADPGPGFTLASNTKLGAPACSHPWKHKSRKEESRVSPLGPLKRQMNNTSAPDIRDVKSK